MTLWVSLVAILVQGRFHRRSKAHLLESGCQPFQEQGPLPEVLLMQI